MGLFTTKPKMPKGRVESWDGANVKQWIKFIGFAKYKKQFSSIDGKRLFQMDVQSMTDFINNEADAEAIVAAVDTLRTRDGVPPMEPEPAVAKAEDADAEHEEAGEIPEEAPEDASDAGKWTKTAVSNLKTNHSPSNSYSQEIMAKWAGGASRLHELTSYFDMLGISGHGLVRAAEAAPIVGMIVGALWDLHDAAGNAKGNRANVAQLDAFGQDVLRMFEFRGKQTARMPNQRMQNLFDLVCEAVRVVQNCGRPGWLLRGACDERSVEDFIMVHSTILETLRADNMDSLSNQRRLAYGNYVDTSKPLRRKLKQLGAGSVEAGLRVVRTNEPALTEICSLIDVSPQEVLKELENVTSELDDLATIYTKTVEGNAVEEQLYIRECEDIFDQYDGSHSGVLSFDAVRGVLGDLGLLEGMSASEADTFVLQRFHLPSTASTVTFDSFCKFYKGIKMSRARHELRSTLGVQNEYELKKTFISFCSFGSRTMMEEIDSARFVKLCRDSRIIGKGLTATDVDLFFLKTKAKGSRKATFEQFVQALSLIAEKKGRSLEDVVQQILTAGGPTNSGTTTSFVKFHDDKSTYTGVYARGGPSSVDPNKDLSGYLDRSGADVRGVKKGADVTPLRSSAAYPTSHAVSSPLTHNTPPVRTKAASKRVTYSPVPMVAHVGEFSGVEEVFRAFCLFGTGSAPPPKVLEMDSLRWTKLCRECGLLDAGFTSTTADLIHAKTKSKGARKLTYREFLFALEQVAEAKGVPVQEVHEVLVGSTGPLAVGTRPDEVRFYSDAVNSPTHRGMAV